jgi:hypothetical protein
MDETGEKVAITINADTPALIVPREIKAAVAAAKRDLAKKVLATVSDRTKPCATVIEVESLRIGLEQLFAAEGVAVEGE